MDTLSYCGVQSRSSGCRKNYASQNVISEDVRNTYSEDALYFLFFAVVTYLCDGLFLFSEEVISNTSPSNGLM